MAVGIDAREDEGAAPSSSLFSATAVRRRLRQAGRLVLGTTLVVFLGSLLVALGGANPWEAFVALFRGSFGSAFSFGETLIRFAPLALIAVGLAPSLQSGLFNIGAPGQLGVGALAATLVALGLDGTPGPLVMALSSFAAVAAGALWTLVPALLRAYLRVNEILSTFVFNFLALYFLTFLLTGPMQAPRANVPQSEALPRDALLPVVLHGTRAHVGVVLAVVALIGLGVLSRTGLGYRIRLYGGNPHLAARAGVREGRLVLGLLCLGGAAAGLAGWLQVAGVDQRLYTNVAEVVGYSGLFVALLGGTRAWGIFLASFLFAALLKGGESLQVAASVSPELIDALVGFIVLVFVALRIRRVRRAAG